MGLTQKLTQKQGQVITLTPQLRQAIKLLEISNLDLTDYLSQAVLENPLLGIDDHRAEQETSKEIEGTQQTQLSSLENPDYENLWTNDDHSRLENSFQFKNTFHSGSVYNDQQNQTAASSVTLRDHLQSQVNSSLSNPIDCFIASTFIENLDEGGYLSLSTKAIADQLNYPQNKVDEILVEVQKFDPCGVFARTPQECIALQLEDRDQLDIKTKIFLDNIHLFADGQYDRFMKICQINQNEMSFILQKIRQCESKPGLKYDYIPPDIIIPDVFTYWDNQQGKWSVRMNDRTLPKLYIDENTFQRTQGHKDIKKYIQEHLASASWLIKALEQRTRTIYKVASAIVDHQQDFFSQGVRFLKPLKLKAIAEIVDMHESTISRTTQNKYMSTPRGNFELRYFFSNSIAHMDQQQNSYSAESVRYEIAELIVGEDQNNPYSDDHLVHILAQKGIDIARRTIAKYREESGISTSYLRRRKYTHQKMI